MAHVNGIAGTMPRDDGFHLFEPDSLLPAQFYAAFRHGSAVRAEKHLMLAVLEDALDCFQKYAFTNEAHARQIFGEAYEWIHSGDREWPFSFENICETLEINPNYLRRGLKRWKQHALQTGRGKGGRSITNAPVPQTFER